MAETKLITFDGLAGAGKSTQMRLLRESLNPVTIPEQDRYMELARTTERYACEIKRQFVPEDRRGIIFVLDRLGSIKAAQSDTKQWHKDGYVVVDWFWNWIINYGEDLDVLNAFRAFLRADDGFEPVASFYLKVDVATAARRLTDRGDSPHFDPMDKARLDSILAWISDEVPYFHVLDGERLDNEVYGEIMGILE